MNLLCFLATIYLILSEISCSYLLPQNEVKFKVPGAHTNLQEHSKSNDTQSSENSDEAENYIYCKDEEYLHQFISNDNKSQMIWVTWNRTKAGERAVLPNICSADNGLPLRRRCHYVGQLVEWEHYNNHSVLIDCRLSMYCQPEPFHHYVIQNNGQLEVHQNSWKRAKIGDYSSLRDICLQPNGLHLTRKCFYDHQQQRARWTSVDHLKDYKCLQHTRQEVISKELNILHDNVTNSNVLLRDMVTRRLTAKTLLTLLEKPKTKLLPADVQLTSEIMKTIVADTPDTELSKDVVKITHNLMSTDPIVLRMSAEVNATNSLLETFENYMDSLTEKFVSNCHLTKSLAETLNINETFIQVLDLSNIGVYAHITRNITVFYVNPTCSHISGIAIYNTNQKPYNVSQHHLPNEIHYDSYNDFYYRFIHMNESINNLMQDTHLELAAFIPNDLWLSIYNGYFATPATGVLNPPILVLKIYAHDSLFVEQNLLRTRKPFSKILSITIPGFEGKQNKIVIKNVDRKIVQTDEHYFKLGL